jgi:hypothetical protein
MKEREESEGMRDKGGGMNKKSIQDVETFFSSLIPHPSALPRCV